MKIAIVGCGAMGCVYAALLGAAGHEIWAIDTWQDHVEAMRKTIDALPGRTLIVSSADLSHVGPAFGPTYGHNGPLSGEAQEVVNARNQVFAHDREMVTLLAENKPDELVAAMAWQQNPTRWCSVGNLVATMRIARPTKVDLFNYAAAMDPEGNTMVSSMSMAMS